MLKKLKSLDKGTIIRTILQILAYANQIVAIVCQAKFPEAYQWLSLGITFLITIISYWYNNDWSDNAILVRDLFDMLKDKKIDKSELEDLINKYKGK